MALQAFKTCKVWIPFNPSMFSSGYLRILDAVFPLFSHFLNFWQSFLKYFYFNIWTVFECLSLLATYPFYSVILRFPRYHQFSQFAPLSTRNNVMSAILMASSFLILYYFLLFEFPSSKTSSWLCWILFKLH